MMDSHDLPEEALTLAEKGPSTKAALRALLLTPQMEFLKSEPRVNLNWLGGSLGRTLRATWTDENAAAIVSLLGRLLTEAGSENLTVDVEAIACWCQNHPDDPEAVTECALLCPPKYISVTRRLSQHGAQKRVFRAKWALNLSPVVIKQLLPSATTPQTEEERQLNASHLSYVHRNIAQTHLQSNRRSETFFVEPYFEVVLHDGWPTPGLDEAVALLHDIASALSYLSKHDLVHGNIKPSNIAGTVRGYVLMDFGLCRRRDAFTPELTAACSLGTCAPELLQSAAFVDPAKVDVWMLGATVFKLLAGRYPLLHVDEPVPRAQGPARATLLATLKSRVLHEYDSRLDLGIVPEQLRSVLGSMLSKDSASRCSADQLFQYVKSHLFGYLRAVSGPHEQGFFSTAEELRQIQRFLDQLTRSPRPCLPSRKRFKILEHLEALTGRGDLTAVQRSLITRLRNQLNA